MEAITEQDDLRNLIQELAQHLHERHRRLCQPHGGPFLHLLGGHREEQCAIGVPRHDGMHRVVQ
jgi:hypothetical protein